MLALASDIVAIPYEVIGYNFRAALEAAEGVNGYPGLPWRISLMMFCEPSRTSNRQIKEWRPPAQLKWRYSHEELLPIYANRVWFGEDCHGVQAPA